MSKSLSGLVLVCVWQLFVCQPLLAEPEVSEVVHKYRITGETIEDLRREMNRKGPGGKGGRTFDAYTGWQVYWNFRWWESKVDCRITAVTTQVRVSFTLPEWVHYNKGSRELQQKWDRYYQALYDHEKGHRDFGVRAAREIEQAIWNLERKATCAQLEAAANATAQTILDRYVRLEKQYDVRTDHGAATGAVFP